MITTKLAEYTSAVRAIDNSRETSDRSGLTADQVALEKMMLTSAKFDPFFGDKEDSNLTVDIANAYVKKLLGPIAWSQVENDEAFLSNLRGNVNNLFWEKLKAEEPEENGTIANSKDLIKRNVRKVIGDIEGLKIKGEWFGVDLDKLHRRMLDTITKGSLKAMKPGGDIDFVNAVNNQEGQAWTWLKAYVWYSKLSPSLEDKDILNAILKQFPNGYSDVPKL